VNPCSLGKESVMGTEGRLRVVRVVEGPLGVLIVIRKVVWRAKRAVARGSGSGVLQIAHSMLVACSFLDPRVAPIGVVISPSRVVVRDHADFDRNHAQG
jgi:hypothetical protein